MNRAYQAHTERFVGGPPTAKAPPPVVQMNPIRSKQLEDGATDAVNFPTLPAVKERLRNVA
jgi:hypothetical protein